MIEADIVTPEEILAFVAKLDRIVISGDRSQKHLEYSILVLEHLAKQAAAGKVHILEKE